LLVSPLDSVFSTENNACKLSSILITSVPVFVLTGDQGRSCRCSSRDHRKPIA
jgi:hypothetical protein